MVQSLSQDTSLPSKTEKMNSRQMRNTRSPRRGIIISLRFHKLLKLQADPVFTLNKDLLSSMFSLYSAQSTVYSVNCTVYSAQSTVYSVNCTVYSAQSTVYSVNCTVHTAQCTVHHFYSANADPPLVMRSIVNWVLWSHSWSEEKVFIVQTCGRYCAGGVNQFCKLTTLWGQGVEGCTCALYLVYLCLYIPFNI
eukprot:GFUD01086544.1.p1 GENE.GFUD01086544.1~~GFUD01086544.1.p1  ORF type:complete len:194 (+),score=16.09 GFUD01086544.1:92-673(+)